MKLTVEEARQRFLDVGWDCLSKDPWVDEEDRSEYEQGMNEMVMEQGGWEKFHKDLLTGVENGYTIEQQFELMKKVYSL
jgi:hypothetical protein